MKYRILAIIPARGGSKRIPGKNIKFFFGHPIIKYSIDAASGANIFDEVMVSTEDEMIAAIARKYGAVVPFLRSDSAASDTATTADVIVEVLSEYKKNGKEFDYLCCLYPAAPFVTSEKLIKALQLIINGGHDSVFPVVSYSSPIQRAMRIEDGLIKMITSKNYDKRSQDLAKTYHDCGQFYFVKINSFLKHRKLFTNNSAPLITGELESQDIDNETDWEMAELKYRLLRKLN